MIDNYESNQSLIPNKDNKNMNKNIKKISFSNKKNIVNINDSNNIHNNSQSVNKSESLERHIELDKELKGLIYLYNWH
jgi:hypothetical protein